MQIGGSDAGFNPGQIGETHETGRRMRGSVALFSGVGALGERKL
jgi:hypothetical protein